MLLVSGAKVQHFVFLSIPVAIAGVAAVLMEPYRLKRLIAFRDPFQDALGTGWQIIQSLYAIGSGGLFGVGFGNSRQKFLYVSEPQNDFIFAIVCEELGFVGAALVIGLVLALLLRGYRIASRAPDKFSSLVVYGLVTKVALQTVLNIAVVTNSMPNTGISLPFFSSGGTSLAMQIFEMGIVLSISRYSYQER